MRRLLLVRHGETTWNVTRRYQGQSDVPLNVTGKQQATAIAEWLASFPIDIIYASDLSRAWETAQVIATHHDVPLHPDPKLREMSFGEWQGLTYEEMISRFPDQMAWWNEDRMRRAAPGGETLTQVAERVQAVLDNLMRQHPEHTVLLVAHGGVLKILLCLLLNKSPSEYWQFKMDNVALTEIDWHPLGPRIVKLNDTQHLEKTR